MSLPTFKVVLVGDSGVGKSSLLNRYFDGDFSDYFNTTIGIDFKSKEINVKEKTAKLQIWDTAGQERFRNITTSYYRKAHCFILMFDTTNKDSFANLNYWYGEIQKNKTRDALMVLIGTKKDMKDIREVFIDSIRKFTFEKNMKYFETSAKMNDGIDFIFDYITDILIDKFGDEIKNRDMQNNNNNNDNNNNDMKYRKIENEKNGCCK
jgi:Ras-related protein Rab-1A